MNATSSPGPAASASSGVITLAADPAMLGDRPIADAVRAVAAAGYPALELSPRQDFLPGFAPPATTPTLVKILAREAAAAGVVIASTMVVYNWSSPDEDERRAAVGYWRTAISIAADLGCGRLNTEFAGDPRRPSESEAAFRRSFEDLLPSLEAADVDLFVEPHPYDFVETGADALRILGSLGNARVGYIYCSPHAFYLGGSIPEQIAAGGPLLGHVHLADTYSPRRIIVNPRGTDARVHQHLDIGQGEVDWPTVFSSLAQTAWGGLMTVSVFAWPERAEASLIANLAKVRELASTSGLAVRTNR